MADYFEDDILAYVYIGREGNDRNKILLTKKQLIVIRHNKERIFDINDIKLLKITSRRLLLPLVSGGVIFPFSMLSMFTGVFSPYTLLFTILLSIYLLYLGFTGHPVICLKMQPKEYDISVNLASENIRAFVNFSNTLMPKSHVPAEFRMIYVPIRRSVYSGMRKNDTGKQNVDSYEAFTYEQWQTARSDYPLSEWIVILIDPLNVKAKVSYRTNRKTGKLQPLLQGELNEEYFHRIID